MSVDLLLALIVLTWVVLACVFNEYKYRKNRNPQREMLDALKKAYFKG